MAVPYSFWLRGTTYAYNAVATGAPPLGIYVPTNPTVDSPPTSLLKPSLANGWIKVFGLGTSAEIKNEGETYVSPARFTYQDSKPRWVLTIDTLRYVFPDDFAAYKLLLQHISSPYLFFCEDDYDVVIAGGADSGYVLPVTCDYTVEHNYADATKRLTLTLSHRAITKLLNG